MKLTEIVSTLSFLKNVPTLRLTVNLLLAFYSSKIIAIVCLILMRTYELNFGGDPIKFADRYNVGLIAVGGMLLVSLPLLVSYLWSAVGAYQPFLEFMYNLLGFVLFMAAGGLALDHYTNQLYKNEAGLALGVNDDKILT